MLSRALLAATVVIGTAMPAAAAPGPLATTANNGNKSGGSARRRTKRAHGSHRDWPDYQDGHSKRRQQREAIPTDRNGSHGLPRHGQWWTFDDAWSIQQKTTWLKSKGLLGAMVWEMSGDISTGTLMTTLHNGL